MIFALGARWSYLVLIAWQPLWHFLLPAPLGNANWVLAVAATAPLLLPAPGVWRGALRSITWAGYLTTLYLAIGAMEAWANPAQRPLALVQVLLVAIFIACALGVSGAVRPRN